MASCFVYEVADAEGEMDTSAGLEVVKLVNAMLSMARS